MSLLTIAHVAPLVHSIQGSDRERDALAATRRRLYAGAGLCAASALGAAGASLADLPVALMLFAAATPVLGLQVVREYRLCGRLQRRRDRLDAGRETLF